jgi:hypothetical protein
MEIIFMSRSGQYYRPNDRCGLLPSIPYLRNYIMRSLPAELIGDWCWVTALVFSPVWRTIIRETKFYALLKQPAAIDIFPFSSFVVSMIEGRHLLLYFDHLAGQGFPRLFLLPFNQLVGAKTPPATTSKASAASCIASAKFLKRSFISSPQFFKS